MPTGHQDFDLVPSLQREVLIDVEARGAERSADVLAEGEALAVLVDPSTAPPSDLKLSKDQLSALGFAARPGQTLLTPAGTAGGLVVAVGVAPGPLDASAVRDAAASFSVAAGTSTTLVLPLPATSASTADAVTAAIEGAVLARYSFSLKHRTSTTSVPLGHLTVIVDPADLADAAAAVTQALAIVGATELGRDLANAPGGQLTAARLGEIAEEVGHTAGLEVEVFGQDALVEMGLGGLLAVNLGSAEPARMIKLSYTPEAPEGRLALVGKGIMYDSGGISLKPSDGTHAQMKNDMSGAGSVLAAMTALKALGCRAEVTGYLMCTDNMPSGTALKLGDVITVRGGTTVEIINTDAEGRLVMSDALVLAVEDGVDAIVDIATLTGATLRALGPDVAGVMGNDQPLLEQVKAAAGRVDEPVWEFPLIESYRPWLDSPIADLVNLGGVHAGQITAALFLREFVNGIPWAHIDIAGTAQRDARDGWRPPGATGFGTRLLIDLALNFAVS